MINYLVLIWVVSYISIFIITFDDRTSELADLYTSYTTTLERVSVIIGMCIGEVINLVCAPVFFVGFILGYLKPKH